MLEQRWMFIVVEVEWCRVSNTSSNCKIYVGEPCFYCSFWICVQY